MTDDNSFWTIRQAKELSRKHPGLRYMVQNTETKTVLVILENGEFIRTAQGQDRIY
jgi:hypothetical protein